LSCTVGIVDEAYLRAHFASSANCKLPVPVPATVVAPFMTYDIEREGWIHKLNF
jgi:hypothetical protein